MKDTIISAHGYHVVKGWHIITGERCYRIDEGSKHLFVARKRSYEDYQDEKHQNECFNQCGIFTTVEGNQFIYWRDEEIDADYITEVPKEDKKPSGDSIKEPASPAGTCGETR